MRVLEVQAQKAAVKGIPVTAASGDDGSVDRSPTGKAQVDFPSASKYITGVGGTSLFTDAKGNYQSEKVWSGNGAGGGGRSMQVPRPDYQKGIDMPANINGSKFDGRGVPDIAFNADPRTGYKIWTDQGMQVIGGTSASAPIAAVIASKLYQATGKQAGFLNPALYNFGLNNPSVYHDVINGNNDGYSASKGWDPATGLGSINCGAMLDALKRDQTATGKVINQFPTPVQKIINENIAKKAA